MHNSEIHGQSTVVGDEETDTCRKDRVLDWFRYVHNMSSVKQKKAFGYFR